jgi:phenylpyruvate tautomerase PptA (4-oxalocrotonate tautomerase family)
MPFYQQKAEVAAAVTAVHAEVTGAPGDNSCP